MHLLLEHTRGFLSSVVAAPISSQWKEISQNLIDKPVRGVINGVSGQFLTEFCYFADYAYLRLERYHYKGEILIKQNNHGFPTAN
jgi:hypothetical protein